MPYHKQTLSMLKAKWLDDLATVVRFCGQVRSVDMTRAGRKGLRMLEQRGLVTSERFVSMTVYRWAR